MVKTFFYDNTYIIIFGLPIYRIYRLLNMFEILLFGVLVVTRIVADKTELSIRREEKWNGTP